MGCPIRGVLISATPIKLRFGVFGRRLCRRIKCAKRAGGGPNVAWVYSVCVLNEKNPSRYESRCTVYDKCLFTARYECMSRYLVKTFVYNPPPTC